MRLHGRSGRRLVARQHQQLLHEAAGAVDAGLQARGGAFPGVVVAGAAQALHLQLERGQWRAQLVGGIGHETLLSLERLAHPPEQAIELAHQRADLVGQAILAHRFQVGALAPGDLAPDA